MAVEFPFDPDPDDLPELTPHDRLRELAAIFAAGLSRLKTCSDVADGNSDEPAVVIEKVP